MSGCGGSGLDALASRSLLALDCEGSEARSAFATDLVLLDWDGGTSRLYPDTILDPLDLEAFETADGSTLADRADEFRERIRRQITQIFCDFPDADVRIEQAGKWRNLDATVVHLAQIVPPNGGAQIGEGEYDPCNKYHDDAAIIFGEQIRRLGGPRSFDEWAFMFANVTAHEIGHMLGFGHISRDQQSQAQRSLYVELMLDGHTIDELQREQRFVVAQTNCPMAKAAAGRCTHKPILELTVGR